jgi:RHS repeat-associated protein
MKKLLILTFLLPFVGFSQSTTENYVVTKTYREAATTRVDGHDKEKVSTTVQYYDGLGRLKQTVAVEAGGSKVLEGVKDIVTHVEYDALGRQKKEFLPYTQGTGDLTIRTGDVGLATQEYYYQKYTKDFAGVALPTDVNAYSEKEFDGSPLNRVMKQAAPGEAWGLGNDHEIQFDYDANVTGEVKIYGVTTSFANNTYTPTLTGGTTAYTAGELYKTITKDENWSLIQTYDTDHTTEEFKNKQGQVILKRTYNKGEKHDTYYVYDDFGNLTYVLPPKSEADVNKPTTTELNELCYQYVYDHRNRLVEKKIPGKGWEYIVYNKIDQPVLTQDAMQRRSNNSTLSYDRWLITKYDAFGRLVYTGYTNNNGSRVSLQNAANSDNYTQYEKRTTQQTYGGATIYYTKEAIPNGVSYIYSINYYDSYDNVLPTGLVSTVTTVYGQTSTTRTKSLATVSKVRVLDTNNWITTVTYYDEKARPIYVYRKNDELGTVDIVESKLHDLTGKVLETTTTHQKAGKDDIVTVDRFEYDHMDRLVSQTQGINDQVSERVLKNNYDDLGQLESKLLGNGTQEGYKYYNSSYVSIQGNLITKTNTSSSWNTDVVTKGKILGDGYVEFTAVFNNKNLMVGLSNDNDVLSYTSIKYAVYLRTNGIASVYESGSHKGYFGNYEPGDVFKVERIGDKVYYKKNDKPFYVSAVPSTGALHGDISMYHSGGQIKDFKIVDNSKGLQKVDYDYNVRGWLTKINQDAVNDNDLFNFSIAYNNPTSGTPLYNGNISQTSWNSLSVNNTSNPVSNQYTYSYDALNRITQAVDNTGNYNLNFVGYDKNGNIKFLERNGAINSDATSFGMMDDLQYVYDSGNKLKRVTDIENPTYGFIDVNTDTDYTYDANGNMISDSNKRITNISYNHLNLPTRVTINGQNINYMYDANGVKLSKNVNNITTEYAGNYIYENNTLQFFNHPEGYVKPNFQINRDGSQGLFLSADYVYQYKDHLGNVRLSYIDNNNDGVITPSTEIIEESNYYPFGLKHKGYNGNVSSIGNSVAQKWNFLGQESNEELGLNWLTFRYRNYDAAIGRFFGVDPISEDYMSISTYQFAHNNPVWKIEIEGLEGYPLTGTDNLNYEPVVGHTMLSSQPEIASTASSTGGGRMITISGAENGGGIGTLRTGQFNESDFGGVINPATDAMYNSDPAGAVLQDVTFTALSFVGANAIDDAVATASDPNASTLDVAEATVNALTVGKGGKGKGIKGSGVTGHTKHGLNQSINRNGGRGVSAKAKADAITNPKSVTSQDGGRTKFKGKKATVVTNSDGKIITTFGSSRSKTSVSQGRKTGGGKAQRRNIKETGASYNPNQIK